MGIVALVAWLATAGAGLYLLAVWLIEYDRDVQAASATRLPVPVISAHALLAVGGLIVWSVYLFLDDERLAWIAVAIILSAAVLGMSMAVRWFGVYRDSVSPPSELAPADGEPGAAHAGPAAWQSGLAAADRGSATARGGRASGNGGPAGAHAGPAGAASPPAWAVPAPAVPPERYFPLSVVLIHGVLAVSTVILVLLTVLGYRNG